MSSDDEKYYAAKQEVRAEGVKGVLDVLHEEHKDLRRKVGIIAGLLIMFFGAFLIGFGLLNTRIDNGLVTEHHARQTEVSGLSVLLTPTATPTVSIDQAISNAENKAYTPERMPTVTRVATATLVVAPTATPVRYSIETKLIGTTMGTGAFKLTMEAVSDSDGWFSEEGAIGNLQGMFKIVLAVCPYNHLSNVRRYVQVDAGYYSDLSSAVPSSCWDALWAITHVKVRDTLSLPTTIALADLTKVSEKRTIFISYGGKILGTWSWSKPPIGEACFEKALIANGYIGNGYFPVEVDTTVFGLLSEAGFPGFVWPELSNSCNPSK